MTTETKFTVGECETRDGRRARVYATDGYGCYPIHGAMFDARAGGWRIQNWRGNGFISTKDKDGADLMPPLREWWICATGTGSHFTFFEKPSKENEWAEIIHVREVRDDQA